MTKVVIQTGDILDRAAIDEFLAVMPANWNDIISSVVVYGSRENDLSVSYHPSEKVVGIHCPSNCATSKWEALEELAVGLFAVADLGHIPKRLSSSKKKEYAQRWQEHRCGV